MKRLLSILIVILVTAMLGGCLLSKTPKTNDVAMDLGDHVTFSVNVFPSGGTYAWTLDGTPLSNTTKSYIYVAENGGEHALTVKAKQSLGTDTQTWTITSPYAIGDIGPAGGWIFYDKGSYSDGWRYLEAAQSNFINKQKWWNGTNEIRTGAIGVDVGTGKANTAAIIAAHAQGAGDDYAAKVCDDYIVIKDENIYDDWFLPSKGELNLMYTSLKIYGVGGFTDEEYWSSTERDQFSSWSQDFGTGAQHSAYMKNNSFKFRAIREF
jgi:hypothetical protein